MAVEGLSLTKGCVLIKPGQVSKKMATDGKFASHPAETEKEAQRRYQKYIECSNDIENKIESIFLEYEEAHYKEMKDFVEENSIYLNSLTPSSDDDYLIRQHRIPSILVNGAFDMPNRSKSFHKFKETLSSITPLVIFLQTFSSMRLLMKDIVQQIISCERKEKDEDEDLPRIRLPDYSVSMLCDWYTEFLEEREDRPTVVFVLENLEEFPVSILTDLVSPLSTHLQDFPVLLIISTVNIIDTQNILPQSIMSQLQLTIKLNDPLQTVIPEVLEMLCFDSSLGMHITPSYCRQLLNHFDSLLIPTASFRNQIKHIILEHFHWQPLSFLNFDSQSSLESSIRNMSHNHCEMLRATNSFMRHIETVDEDMKRNILTDDTELKKYIEPFLISLQHYYHYILPVLDCLYRLKRVNAMVTKKKNLSGYLDSILKDDVMLVELSKDVSSFHEILKCCCKELQNIKKSCPELLELSYILEDLLKDIQATDKERELTLGVQKVTEFMKSHVKSPSLFPLNEVICYNKSGGLYGANY